MAGEYLSRVVGLRYEGDIFREILDTPLVKPFFVSRNTKRVAYQTISG